MARPRRPIPKDTPEVIRTKMRERPQDFSIVVAKRNDGSIVKVTGEKQPMTNGFEPVMNADGTPVMTHFHPWTGPIPEDVRTALSNGGADLFAFRWGNSRSEMRMSELGGGPQWRPVKAKENLCWCPYAFGDKTDGMVRHADQILLCRDREYDAQVRADKASFSVEKMLASTEENMTDQLKDIGGRRVKSVRQEFEPSEKDAVTLSDSRS